jgi:hypothetical protein
MYELTKFCVLTTFYDELLKVAEKNQNKYTNIKSEHIGNMLIS